MNHLRIATRASDLALWQSRHVAACLEAAQPGLTTELVRITTTGDRIVDRPLASIGGKGLFIKELEVAIADERADIAVHSMKDVPFELPGGFVIAAILERQDPRDVLVSRDGLSLDALPSGARVGTSSLRRRSQLLARRPDLVVEDLRGNVPTRLKRFRDGEYAAVILAAAGLRRLDLYDDDCHALSVEDMLPAVGQGAIGIECRADAPAVRALVNRLDHPETATRVAAERAMNARLGGSCHVPVAGFARVTDDELRLEGLVCAVDGTEQVRHTARGPSGEAAEIGRRLGETLLAGGGTRILADLQHN